MNLTRVSFRRTLYLFRDKVPVFQLYGKSRAEYSRLVHWDEIQDDIDCIVHERVNI